MDNLTRALELRQLSESSSLKIICSPSELSALRAGLLAGQNWPCPIQFTLFDANGSIVDTLTAASVTALDDLISVRVNISPVCPVTICSMNMKNTLGGLLSSKAVSLTASQSSPMTMEWYFLINGEKTSNRPSMLEYTDTDIAWDTLG